MMKASRKTITTATAVLGLLLLVGFISINPQTKTGWRSLKVQRRALSGSNEKVYNPKELPHIDFQLPPFASTWCNQPSLPPLDYTVCNPNDIVYYMKYTSGVQTLLLGVIKAFEENRCIYLEREDHKNDVSERMQSFFDRYLEPIGLSSDDPIVVTAQAQGKTRELDWEILWSNPATRRKIREFSSLSNIGYINVENTWLKKIMYQRMWRPRAEFRIDTCKSLESLSLDEEYLAWHLYGFDSTDEESIQRLYTATREQVERFFGGKMPKIFTAADDCKIVYDLRKRFSNWKIVSACDLADGANRGGLPHYSVGGGNDDNDCNCPHPYYDLDLRNYYIDLTGLATAKIYIGDTYSAMAWNVFLMKQHRWSFQVLNAEEGKGPEMDW